LGPRLLALATLIILPLGLYLLDGGPAYAATRPSSGATGTTAALEGAYAAARHLPAGAVGGVRAGSLHTGSVSGVEWAIADFVPAASAASGVQSAFQDGAASAVFSQSPGGPWRVVVSGPYGCGTGLPQSLISAWGLARPSICDGVTASQRSRAASAAAQAATGSGLGERIAHTALTQVGVSDLPAETSFSGVDCDPYSTLVGAQSPNADGCGLNANLNVENENEAWCSDFAKWVWQQAGVTADMGLINAGSVSFYQWGLAVKESLPIDGGTPAVGDAVVFFPPGTVSSSTYADHVGIVSSVNADGTVDLVNGDFLGSTNISVEYDTDINLTTWASQVWNQGEQWVLVAPPAGPRVPNPVAAVSGPSRAVVGTSLDFSALGASSGGSTTYQWTFGDGRTTDVTGGQAGHVYAEAGIYPVTLTATSSAGTVTTRTQDVDVVGSSSTVADAISPAVWYSPGPVDQYLFLPGKGSGLVSDVWDGAGWLQQALPGSLDAGSGLTSLSYPDAAAAYAMIPHAYYSSGGTLAETYLGASGWTSQALAGQPAGGSAIVATTGTGSGGSGPAIFYVDAAGQLAETEAAGGSWTTSTIPGTHTGTPGSLAVADTVTPAGAGVDLFYLSGQTLMAAASVGGGWIVSPVAFGVNPKSPLSAVSTGADQVRVLFVDGQGRLAATRRNPALWTTQVLPGAPSPATALEATSYLEASGALGEEVYYLTASGPSVTYSAGQGWQAQALPGSASGILGADAYQWAGQPQRLFLASGGQDSADQAAAPAGPWTGSALPASPATFADTVLLYAATPADAASAQSAAAAAGLPAAQVTTSFDNAWGATLSGDYLVIAVGSAAADALDYNVCGWSNPSGDDPGSTPFYYAYGPLDQLPGADVYEWAAAADASQTPALAADLAYYATHGALPTGVSSLPSPARSAYACAGQPT
jgi:PKD repeat protein